MWSQPQPSPTADSPRHRFRRAQPAVAEYIEQRVATRRARKLAVELATRLFVAYWRYGKTVPTLTEEDLEAATFQRHGDPDNPVNGWRYALPIPLAGAEQRDVSKVLSVIVAAVEPKVRAIG